MTAETQTVPGSFSPEFYQELIDHALIALRVGKPFVLNADGAYALVQQAASDRAMLAAAPAPAGELREAVQAVLDRWDSPLWKDQGPTAVVMNRLRAALAAHGSEGQG